MISTCRHIGRHAYITYKIHIGLLLLQLSLACINTFAYLGGCAHGYVGWFAIN